MKTYSNFNIYSKGRYLMIALFALVSLQFTGCKKDFEKFNTDNTGLDKGQFQIGLVYPFIQTTIFGLEGNYQLDQNLNADVFSGYMMSPTDFRGNINNLNYSMVDGWNQQIYIDCYKSLFNINYIASTGARTAFPDFWAVALILKVETFSRLTDKFGPVAYSKSGQSTSSTPYDTQQAIYQQFFLELDTAVTNLSTFIAAHPADRPFEKYDLVYGGDYSKWLKLANSMRLRLAMHIVKVDPSTAKTQAEKALNPVNGGLLTSNADNAGISGGGYHNPLNVLTTSWTDIAMGASLESYMVGYNDPRLPKYVSPATDPAFKGQFKGIRIGSPVPSKPAYSGFSVLNVATVAANQAPMLMMTAAEVWFLKAEAALRGWTGAGDVQSNYVTGIQTSMSQWGVTDGSYSTDATSLPKAYVDPLNAANNSAAVSTITVNWDAGATNEQKLERIITQKWLAMFPEGQEAWTEFRRTGYPKLFTVVTNNSNGAVDTQIQIRRLPYPQNEYSTNKVEIQKAVQLLGGPDNAGTRIWWDVNKPNF